MFEFESQELKIDVERMLKKKITDIASEELKTFKDIGLKKINFLGHKTDYTINDLIWFEDLEKCSLFKFTISEGNIETLNKLKKLDYIYFDFCEFDSVVFRFNSSISTLVFNMCMNLDLSKLKNTTVRKLKMIGNTLAKVEIDISSLESVTNLEKLEIHNYIIKNVSKLLDVGPNLKVVNFDGCIIEDYEGLELIQSRVKVSCESDFKLTGLV